ncbi:MAG: VanZ family protein [Candidatus Neomarinimicrobiota bacterium]
MKNIWLKLPAILYAVLIFGLSSLPKTPLTLVPIWNIDKLAHLTEYTIFGVLLMLAFTGGRPGAVLRRTNYGSFFSGAIYGLSDEIHQYFVPGRICSAVDLSADLIGILLGIWIFNHWHIFRKFRAS